MTEWRPLFKVGDSDRGYDHFEATLYGSTITLEIDEPWAGSTETGFGQTCTMSISLDDARALAAWLIEAAVRGECNVPN
jgi:hypothetical protein